MIRFWNINYSHHFSPDELMNLFTWLIQNQKQCIFVWFWMQKIIIDKPIPKRQQKYSILSIKSNTNMIIVKRESESYKENWNLGKFDSVEEFLKKGKEKEQLLTLMFVNRPWNPACSVDVIPLTQLNPSLNFSGFVKMMKWFVGVTWKVILLPYSFPWTVAVTSLPIWHQPPPPHQL